MKKIYLALLTVLLSFCAIAQKENNVWLGGAESGLNFNSGFAVPFTRSDSIYFDVTDASIADKNGNLLFFTNGYYVLNRNFQMMPNGNHLNIGDYGGIALGQSVADGAAIVPVPRDSSKYYLFYVDLNFVNLQGSPNTLIPTHLMYSVVDMALDGGLGDINDKKDIVILSDTLTSCGFKVVKHANGRDYWLICHEYNSNRYYRFLIDPYGIHGPYSQYIGYDLVGDNALDFSTLTFNQNADMAAQLLYESTAVELYNFDRCTGELYNLINFNVSDSIYYVSGSAFSPSGKYLYVSANWWNYIWQFDVAAPNIFASRKLVAKYDGALNPLQTNFYELRLAPDNKIYIHSYDDDFSIHVINSPDSGGASCDFVENAIHFNPPGFSWNGFPNIVNYSLGALSGACDTLTGIKQVQPTFALNIYPNPTQNELTIDIPNNITPQQITVIDNLGRVVLSVTPNKPKTELNINALAAGLYFIKTQLNNGTVQVNKFVKQ